MANITFDKERVSFHKAWIKKQGETFEISVNPEEAVKYIEGQSVEIAAILQAQKIFSDVDRGIFASENRLKELFQTTDILKIAKEILDNGEIHLTAEYRNKLREQKRKYIVNLIHKNVVDPRNHLPHPAERIEAAMEEAKIKIDEYKKAEEQVEEIIRKLQPILPMRIEKHQLRIYVNNKHAGKVSGFLKKVSNVMNANWGNDGSWVANIEIPAGYQMELIDKLNSMTHGDIDIQITREK